eukprot:5889647-Alexandrium_andersonii.AAC.1
MSSAPPGHGAGHVPTHPLSATFQDGGAECREGRRDAARVHGGSSLCPGHRACAASATRHLRR